MAKVLEFPQPMKSKKTHSSALAAMKTIESRLGVPFSSYMGKWSEETESKIGRSLRKETMLVATRNLDD